MSKLLLNTYHSMNLACIVALQAKESIYDLWTNNLVKSIQLFPAAQFFSYSFFNNKILTLGWGTPPAVFMVKKDNKSCTYHTHPSFSPIVMHQNWLWGSIMQSWETALIAIHLHIQPFHFILSLHFTSAIQYVISLAVMHAELVPLPSRTAKHILFFSIL